MIPEEPTPEQVQALVDACPQAASANFRYTENLPDGLHRLRILTFLERAIEALPGRREHTFDQS